MAKELTVKQKKLVQGVAAGKSKKQAAIDAGYSPRSAHQTAHETLKIPTVREAFLKAMKDAGITDAATSKAILEGLSADRPHGEHITMVPDHPTRLKAAKMIVDITGVEAPKKLDLRDQTLEDLLTLDDEAGAS